MAVLQYAEIFRNILTELYGQAQISVDLYNSNSDIQIVNGKTLKIPKLSVSGYKDHSRNNLGFNAGTYSNDYEVKTLDHDRDIEFAIDPMDIDETNMVVAVANIQKRFETTQAIPEADCYTFSKLYTEAKRVGAKVKTEALTTANVLSDFDDNLEAMTEAGVPLDRVILYCTPAYYKLLKNADGSAVQMDYILIDPECQVSRNKYSYISVFTPGTDSRTADNYVYQNRKFNGTFAIDELLKDGCIIHTAAA